MNLEKDKLIRINVTCAERLEISKAHSFSHSFILVMLNKMHKGNR